jgi:hypothetical protein
VHAHPTLCPLRRAGCHHRRHRVHTITGTSGMTSVRRRGQPHGLASPPRRPEEVTTVALGHTHAAAQSNGTADRGTRRCTASTRSSVRELRDRPGAPDTTIWRQRSNSVKPETSARAAGDDLPLNGSSRVSGPDNERAVALGQSSGKDTGTARFILTAATAPRHRSSAGGQAGVDILNRKGGWQRHHWASAGVPNAMDGGPQIQAHLWRRPDVQALAEVSSHARATQPGSAPCQGATWTLVFEARQLFPSLLSTTTPASSAQARK